MGEKRHPLGILILGGLNFFVFGLLFLLIFLGSFFRATPQDLEKIAKLFKDNGMEVTMTFEQFRIINITYILASLLFLVSGWGLLRKYEWARKLTVYFSFGVLFFIFITALFNFTLISQLIVYAIYPGMLIVYFTSKKIENYFKNGASINAAP
jgi:hypothetical protein